MKWRMVALALALAGCGADEAAFGAGDEAFVATMVELRRAAETAADDTTQFRKLKESILAERSVTEEELRAYVDAHASDLKHMAVIWDSVSARLADRTVQ